MRQTKCVALCLTIPVDTKAALKRAAEKRGVSLSVFMTEAAVRELPEAERKKLSPRLPAHRPAG